MYASAMDTDIGGCTLCIPEIKEQVLFLDTFVSILQDTYMHVERSVICERIL